MKDFIRLNILTLTILLSCSNNTFKADNKNLLELAKDTSLMQNVVIKKDTLKFANVMQIVNFFNKKTDSVFALRDKAYKTQKMSKSESNLIHTLDSLYYGFQDERNRSIYEYISTHEKEIKNLDGLKYLVVDKKISIFLIDSLLKTFSPAAQSSKLGIFLNDKIKERQKFENISSYNSAILDLRFESQDGKLIALNQINSDFILLDFWASWCAPCRFENRVLSKKKEQIFENSRISIVAVSLDTNKDKWLKASKEDSLSYLTICDFKVLESPLCKEFKVKTVPYNVLIDKNGKVLAHNLWDTELKDFIRTIPKK